LGILQFSILQCRMCHSAHSRFKDSMTRLSYDNALDVDVCEKHFGNGVIKLRRMLCIYDILNCTGSDQRVWKKG